jgi:hypothetical protein
MSKAAVPLFAEIAVGVPVLQKPEAMAGAVALHVMLLLSCTEGDIKLRPLVDATT